VITNSGVIKGRGRCRKSGRFVRIAATT